MIEVIKRCRESGIHVAVETSLSVNISEIERHNAFDLIIDHKIFDPVKHLHYTGKPNDRILENFKNIATMGLNILVRIPIVKNITALKIILRKSLVS